MIKVAEMRVVDLVPYENNPRHNEKAIEAVANSIKAFGFKNPIIIDRNNVIICGHSRLEAAKRLGLDVVPVIHADDLTEEQVRAFRLADNKTAELAEWDLEALDEELDKLKDIDMSQFGFDFVITEGNVKNETIEDEFEPTIPEEAESKRGQLFRLGDHYLMCGDSTNESDVKKLMHGTQSDIVFTSPPYGASNVAKIRDHYIRGKQTKDSFYHDYEDDISEWFDLLQKSFKIMQKYSKAQFVNIQMLADNKRDFIKFLNEHVNNIIDIVVWDKGKAPPQMQKNILNNQFEFIIIFGGSDASRTIPFAQFHGSINNVLNVRVGNNEYSDIHRAVFPIELPAEVLRIASQAETVIDPFGGTGTTMMACEQLGRKCYMMELDPKYCDVIIQRWEAFTGRKAELIEG